MEPTSRIEISRSALKNNLEFLRSYLGSQILISSVIKGNAYGHGIEVFAPLAEELGVKHFSVFSADEAYRTKKSISGEADIMIMGMVEGEELAWAIENEISFFTFDESRLRDAIKYAKEQGKVARVQLEVESGMHRTGFEQDSIPRILKSLKATPHARLEGLCTHYAGAESIANHVRIRKQRQAYQRAWRKVNTMGYADVIRHTACSAASIRYPDTRMDMVRIGILQYGFWPSRETFIEYVAKNNTKESPLWRLISWKSRVMSTKKVELGEFVGYGTTYLAQKDMKIAVIPVGYSHGFSRGLSNQGRVLIRGRRHPVIGVVNMNALAVDITDMPEIDKGDEVILIGEEGDVEISVSSFSELSDQLNYELLTRLPMNIPRVVVK